MQMEMGMDIGIGMKKSPFVVAPWSNLGWAPGAQRRTVAYVIQLAHGRVLQMGWSFGQHFCLYP